MAMPQQTRRPHSQLLHALLRKDSLAGLLFIAVASAGLWIARDYSMGTLRRMGSGYLPTMLCWLLMGLGAIVLAQGLLARGKPSVLDESDEIRSASNGDAWAHSLWPVAVVTASLVAFALAVQPLGLLAAIVALVLIASFAYRGLGWGETLITAGLLTVLCWAVFVLGLGMTVNLLPEL